MKYPILIIMCFLLINTVSAASIHGSLYDFSLNKINNAIIEINTEPAQRHITQNSSYNFQVKKGAYIISAKTINNKTIASENITIIDEGDYVLDIISFIDLEENKDLEEDVNLEIEEIEIPENNKKIFWGYLIFGLIIITILFYYIFKKRNKKYEEKIENNLTDKIIKIIKKEDGRITQKELRKMLPYSEAKISLIITELEHQGKIEKIKKGRTNIIIIKK